MSNSNQWKQRAEILWQMLDDIDTADDMAKDNDDMYRSLVRNIHRKRFELANSPDGYNLEWK